MQWIPWASPELDEPEHLEPLCVELQRALRGESIEVCVSVPPRHGKSTTVHHAAAKLIAENPRKRVLYASYDAEFASKNLRAIRRIFLAVGGAIGDRDNKFEFTTDEGGGVMACGIQAPPTGEGFDLVIIDDPIRRLADALSRAIRERIGTGFSADLYSRQTPGKGTSFVIVATRWHEDDLTGRQAAKGWKVINLPAYVERGGVVCALAPKLWPIEKLEKFRRENEYTWAALYMGDPSPRVGRMFGDVHYVDAVPREGVTAFGVDLAHTAKRRSDRSAIAEGLRASDGVVYIVDFFADRAPITDHIGPGGEVVTRGFVRAIDERMRRRPGARAGMYTGRQEDLVLDLLSRLEESSVYIEARPAITDKRARAQPAAAAWNRGYIRLPSDAPWVEAFVRHVVAFTGADGGEDEEVDCMSTLFDMLQERGAPIAAPKSSTKHQRSGLRQGRRHLMS